MISGHQKGYNINKKCPEKPILYFSYYITRYFLNSPHKQIYSIFVVLKFHESKLGKKSLKRLPGREVNNEKKIEK